MKKYISIAIVSMVLLSCFGSRVSFTPAYNADVVSMITAGAQETSNLYTKIEGSDSTSYSDYTMSYTFIDTEIAYLQAADSIRGYPKSLTILTNDVANKFHQFESYHQKNGHLVPAQAHVYREQMAALWTALLNAELSLNKK